VQDIKNTVTEFQQLTVLYCNTPCFKDHLRLAIASTYAYMNRFWLFWQLASFHLNAIGLCCFANKHTERWKHV